MVNNAAALDLVFSSLSDPTRRKMIERLSRKPMSVGEMGKGFSMSQPAISKHVRILEEAGLLQRTISGRTHFCSLNPTAMGDALEWIDRQRTYWNASLDRLEAILERESKKGK